MKHPGGKGAGMTVKIPLALWVKDGFNTSYNGSEPRQVANGPERGGRLNLTTRERESDAGCNTSMPIECPEIRRLYIAECSACVAGREYVPEVTS